MTLPEHLIGDKGHRFEIHCEGYPEEGNNVIGWATSISRTQKMADAISLAPGALKTFIIDRKTGDIVRSGDNTRSR